MYLLRISRLTQVARQFACGIGAIALILMATGLFISHTGITVATSSQEDSTSVTTSGCSSSTRGTIKIYDDSQFTAENGVVWGSGTESDPYVIEGWEIEALYRDGITIAGTSAHFIIRDCYVYNGFYYYQYGIVLAGCTNGTLDGNVCSDNLMGIRLTDSSGMSILNNDCSSNDEAGIWLDNSDNNTLQGNTCNLTLWTDGIRGGTGAGIELHSSDNNTLTQNVCDSNSGSGVCIFHSSCCGLFENTLSSNSERGLYAYNSSACNIDGNICSGNAAEGIGISSDSNHAVLRNNTCHSNEGYAGIFQLYSSDALMANNTCSTNDGDGVVLKYSSRNMLAENELRENQGYGVSIDAFSTSNILWNNTFTDNNGAGEIFDPEHVQGFDDSVENHWNMSGTQGRGNYWSDWIAPDSDNNLIVDEPYLIGGAGNARDWYPLAESGNPGESAELTSSDMILAMGLIVVIVAVIVVVLVVMTSRGKSAKAGQAVSPNRAPPQPSQPNTDLVGIYRFCPHCGAQIAPATTWCSKCGRRFSPDR